MFEGETGVRGRLELSSEAGELPADGVEGMAMEYKMRSLKAEDTRSNRRGASRAQDQNC
jgi:hypothetical protein